MAETNARRSCCVPFCLQRGTSGPNGNKVAYFGFPKNHNLRRQWIKAIRRQVKKNGEVVFQIKDESTKVCSLHFKSSDIKKGFGGRWSLKPGSVPSSFAWSQLSPKKRPPPTDRTRSVVTNNTRKKRDKSSNSTSVINENDKEEISLCNEEIEINFNDKKKDETEINLREQLRCAQEKINELQCKCSELQETVSSLTIRCEALQSQVFSLDNVVKKNKEATPFYTGFPNLEAFSATYEKIRRTLSFARRRAIRDYF